MTAGVPGGGDPNAPVQQAIAARAAAVDGGSAHGMRVGPLAKNYYSFTFAIDRPGAPGLFVKIPKADVRHDGATILPISAGDRALAQEEARSLTHLGATWRGADLRVEWVRLAGELPDVNALVTHAAAGGEALDRFRRADILRRFGLGHDIGGVRDAMRRLGTALGRFHAAHAEPMPFDAGDAAARIDRYAREIPEGRALIAQIPRWLSALDGRVLEGRSTITLKGIDLRNILMDDEGRVSLLDPGRMKRTFGEADLSRFLLTYRITHWGSALFPVLGAPDARAERAFLDGYAAGGAVRDPRIYRVYLVKEMLKHWHTALDVLARKGLGPTAAAAVRHAYINRFYIRQLGTELRRPL